MARGGDRKLEDGASVAEHAHRLRARPGWNPAAAPGDAREQLQRQLEQLRTDEVLGQAEDCEACLALRRQGDDAGALCPDHLAQALGL